MSTALKCTTCFLRFDRPMLMPCGFTSCLRCLRRLAAEHHEYIVCPDCLQKHNVPDSSNVESFPVNKIVLDLLASTNGVNNSPRRSAPAPPPVTREIQICSKCDNKTASFEECAHCHSIFCIFCFENHLKSIANEVDNYVAVVEEHCQVASQVANFYSAFVNGEITGIEREKRKEAIFEWGEQLKSLLIRAVGSRVAELSNQIDDMIDEQGAKMSELGHAGEEADEIMKRCRKIGRALRSSARPDVVKVFKKCSQVDQEIRALEKSLESLGLPYLDIDKVNEGTTDITNAIKSLGVLVCDSRRTMEDVVASRLTASSNGIETDSSDPVEFYECLQQPEFVVSKDANNRYFGTVWDCCAYSSRDDSTKCLVVIHNKASITLIEPFNGVPLTTFNMNPPTSESKIRLEVKNVAVSSSSKMIYISQNDHLGVLSLPIPTTMNSDERQLSLVIKGAGDSKFCGMAVDDRAKVIYICDQFRSRIMAWSLKDSTQIALFPFSNAVISGDFKPFKCQLSPTRTAKGMLLAVSDYMNERIFVLALASPKTGSYLAEAVVDRGSELGAVVRPCGMSFDIRGHLLVSEGPTRRVQVFSLMPECISLSAFPSYSDKLRSPRGVSVFSCGSTIDSQIIAVADNAANSIFFFKKETI